MYMCGIADSFVIGSKFLYSFDDLLVGAPLYTANLTEPETGRVFLYRNNGVCKQIFFSLLYLAM